MIVLNANENWCTKSRAYNERLNNFLIEYVLNLNFMIQFIRFYNVNKTT